MRYYPSKIGWTFKKKVPTRGGVGIPTRKATKKKTTPVPLYGLPTPKKKTGRSGTISRLTPDITPTSYTPWTGIPGTSPFTSTALADLYASIDQEGGGGGRGYYGGGGGGRGGSRGTTTADPATWSVGYNVENAPAWWMGLLPSKYDAVSTDLSMMNAMIPFMSPEDQRSTATYLSTVFPEGIGKFYPSDAVSEVAEEFPSELSTTMRSYYSSAERAQQAKGALDSMIKSIMATSKKGRKYAKARLGKGYEFLTSVLGTLEEFGGAGAGEGQTRRQFLQQAGQLDPLLALGKAGRLTPYGPIASRLAQPFFTAGAVTPLMKIAGTQRFGRPDPRRF